VASSSVTSRSVITDTGPTDALGHAPARSLSLHDVFPRSCWCWR